MCALLESFRVVIGDKLGGTSFACAIELLAADEEYDIVYIVVPPSTSLNNRFIICFMNDFFIFFFDYPILCLYVY